MSQSVPRISAVADANVTGRRVAIHWNRRAGWRAQPWLIRDLVNELRRLGLRPRLFTNRERLTRWMQQSEHRHELRCLVAAGGDGTVSDLINRFPDVPLTVLPIGNENLLAKWLRLPRSGIELAGVIARGNLQSYDLGLVGEHRFCLVASVGFDAALVHAVHQHRRRHSSKWQYVWALLGLVGRFRFPQLTIEIEEPAMSAAALPTGERPRRTVTGGLIVVQNLPRYALGLTFDPRTRGDDGVLNVCVFAQKSWWTLLGQAWSLWWGRLARRPDVSQWTATRISIRSSQDDANGNGLRPSAAVQVDGDPLGVTPVEIQVIPRGLCVVVP
jgi:diacylglycerol kinase (ATP)